MKVSDSMTEQIYQVRPEYLNGAGRLFGGKLMQWIDEVAGLVGIRHTRGDVVTASVDNLKFICGAYEKDLIVLTGRVTYVGTTSFEVRVDAYKEDLQGMRYPINRAYLTMVAIDTDGTPRTVPPMQSSIRLRAINKFDCGYTIILWNRIREKFNFGFKY